MAAKTVDAMVNVEPYNAIAVADGIGVSILDFSSFDRMPVLMAATPDFVDKHPDTVVAYLKAWQEVAADFKNNPGKVADVIYSFFTGKGYTLQQGHVRAGAGARRGEPGLPGRPPAYLQGEAEILLREKKINAMPDWKKALRPDFWAKASS